jgi:hypothetical protein
MNLATDRATVLSVNIGRGTPNPVKETGITGIDKRPSAGAATQQRRRLDLRGEWRGP